VSDPTYDFLASGGGAAPTSSGDPTHDFLASGGQIPGTRTDGAPTYDADLFRKRVGRDPSPSELANFRQFKGVGFAGDPTQGQFTLGQAAVGGAEDALSLGTGAVAAIPAAVGYLGGLPNGNSKENARAVQSALTYRPRTEAGQAGLGVLSQISQGPTETAARIADLYDKTGLAGDTVRDVAERAQDVAPLMAVPGLLKRFGSGLGTSVVNSMQDPEGAEIRATPSPAAAPSATEPLSASGAPRTFPSTAEAPTAPPPELSASGAARAPYFEPREIPGRPGVNVDTEPVEGGLPPAAGNERAQILSRVGLDSARNSALEGNAKNAATDWQLSKFDEPAGVAAKAQFDAERTALQSHAENIVRETGGTLGTDEDTLHQRGQTIAKPFDDLSDWFDQRRRELYQAADQRSGGHPVVQPASLQELLNDRSFQNQLTARGQSNIRDGVAAELSRFQEGNQPGLTVQNAEQFRQFLNSLWSPENSNIIGRLKGALDDDVMKGAGEDIYGPARQLAQLKKQTLDNPNGISRLLEHDPQTPINRTTPYVKVPDTIARLDPDQFNNVLRTLETMPEELHPQAQAAIDEIKAHLANKVYDAGTSTSGQWNARGVEKVVRANSAKLQSAFADQPEALRGIQDLRSAGNILSVNQGYPGAAAQAANALKRGLMSRALSKVGATAGAGAGSILGPLGAAGGAAAGEAVGSAAGAKMAERAAVKQWQSGVTRLSDVAR
jgi:hypothetical protein